MSEREPLKMLAPASMKPKFDALHRDVERAAGGRLTRRDALGLAGLALLTAACGGTTASGGGGGGGGGSSSAAPANTLAGKPMENHLEIYNWSDYDSPATFKGFQNLPAAKKAGLTLHQTFFSSNDELLAKLHAGGSNYDIIVPSQNAVGELIQENELMKLDRALLPNLKNLDPDFLKSSYDPTGEYHVIKDYGITMFFYQNTVVTEKPKSMLDFYNLFSKYHSKGRINILDGAEEVVPLALMALGMDPNTDNDADYTKVSGFLTKIRPYVTTINSVYIDDASAGKIILGQGWNGDILRVAAARKKQGDITTVIPTGMSEIWSDNWCIPSTAPDPVAAHAWINYLLDPAVSSRDMQYAAYPTPIPKALAMLPENLKHNDLFNVPKSFTKSYRYILNPSPQIVQKRTQIYTQFKAA